MADEDANISGVSNITDLATNYEVPLLRDNKTPEEIFKRICDDLRKVGKEIKSTIQHHVPSNITSTNFDKTVILPEITSTLHQKASIINKLTNNIRDSNELDFTRFRNEAIMSLPISMVEETSSCVKAVETLDRVRKENQDYIELLSETEKLLTEIEDTEINLENETSDLMRIHKKAKEDYKELRQDLIYVIEALFKDEALSGNMYALLEELVKKTQFQNEADEWYEMEDTQMMPLVMLLSDAGAIVAHPQNNKLMKLIV